MIKITEIPVVMLRTVHYRDEYGNLIRDVEEYDGFRKVNTVTTGKRFAHYFVDFICFQIIILLFQTLINYIFLNSQNFSEVIIITFFGPIFFLLCYPLYYFLFECFLQKTPGKYLTKTVVIDEYGNKPSLSAIILRSIIRLVPFESFSCLGDKNSYGWHDRWSDTFVVTVEELKELKALQANVEIG